MSVIMGEQWFGLLLEDREFPLYELERVVRALRAIASAVEAKPLPHYLGRAIQVDHSDKLDISGEGIRLPDMARQAVHYQEVVWFDATNLNESHQDSQCDVKGLVVE